MKAKNQINDVKGQCIWNTTEKEKEKSFYVTA